MQWVNKSNHIIQDLLRIRENGCDAIIAGGAIRDAFHNIPFTDVDIFVNYKSLHDNVATKLPINYKSEGWCNYWRTLLQCSQYDSINFLGNNYEFGNVNTNIDGVWNIIKGTTNYQIILIRYDPIKYVQDYFDFGICKAYCDGTKMRFTEQFLNDYMNKTITLHPGKLSSEQIIYAKGPHLNKIKAKYPAYTPIIHDTYISL